MSNSISHAEDAAHSGPIKNPKQMLYTVLAAFVLPIFIIIGLVLYVTTAFKPAGSNDEARMSLGGVTEESRDRSLAARLQKIGAVEIRDANRPLKAGEDVFKAQCSACHAAGVAGAPKFGDKDAWAPRIAHGYEALLTAALKGKGAMAAQGGGDFQDVEIGRAVVYMTNAAGGNLPVPQAAAPTTAAAAPDNMPVVAAATPAVAASAVLAAGAPAQQKATAEAVGSAAVAVATASSMAQTAAASAAAPAGAQTPPATALAAGTPPAATAPAAPTAGAAPAAAAAIAAVAPVPASANAAAGEALYKSACFACHAAGVAGAPKFGDKAAWAPRIATGLPTLVAAVKNGKGAMPPRGGSTASDADLTAAVEYMVNAAK